MTVPAHAAARAAGADGMLLAVSRADAGAGAARVRVRYAGFASASGGDFGARLALFAMPACALTTPRVRACQAMTPVRTVNHGKARTLTAAVSAPPATSAPLVLAASSTTSGGTGDFKATSLTPSSQWQVGLQAGDFTYSYPLRVPPPIAEAAPALALSYDSGSTDGETAPLGLPRKADFWMIILLAGALFSFSGMPAPEPLITDGPMDDAMTAHEQLHGGGGDCAAAGPPRACAGR